MAFIARHRLPQLHVEPLFFLGLTSSPARVIDLWQDGERAFTGVVIDTCENATNAAEFLPLACLGEAIPEALFKAAINYAKAEGLQTAYANLEVGAEGSLQSLEPVLRDHGFRQTYAMVRMRRVEAAQPASAIDAGWSWKDLARETVLPAQDLLKIAFNGIPGMNFRKQNVEDEQNWKKTPPVRLLFQGDELAGYVAVLLEPDGAGMVNVIARHPRHRGQNIGAILLNEALGVLEAHGCATIQLNVMAKNDYALSLYRRFGFNADYIVPIYSGSLRQLASL